LRTLKVTIWNNPVKPLQLDVEKILADKNPKIRRVLPGFVIRYLKRIAHQDGINDILRNFANLRGAVFNDAALGYMGITYRAHGVENLPKGGGTSSFQTTPWAASTAWSS
jgi:hypothetical protein